MPLFTSRHVLDQLPLIPLRASSVSTLHSAAAYRTELLQHIAGARHRIYLCSLYLQHDEAGAEILAALHAAKALRPALDIRVLVDWHRAQRGLIGEAKQAGKQAGNAGWYQDQARSQATEVPIYGVPVQTRELFGVLHLKGFVIDDLVIYSGASLNNVYLHKQDKYRHDRYLLLHNKVLADSMVQFIREHILGAAAVHKLDTPHIPSTRSMRREIHEFREQLKRARYDVLSSSPNTPQLSVTPLVGVGKNNPLNRVICQLLAASQEQITICTPYFNFPLAVTREINRALKRGVNIDIIVGDKTANDFYIPPEQNFKVIGALPYLYETNLRRFAKAHQAELGTQLNLHLWKDGDNTYHLKGLWVDRHIMLLTGNNLNPRAFRLDLENALLIQDPEQELAVQRQEELRHIFQHTRPIAHYSAIEKTSDYPAAVRRLLGRLSRTRMDRLAYRVL
ncbi:CDP-diacylglycerol--serine O-phosphatidyltransferase [Undibacterium sp. Jales W-56]|uniref:CDP-diacylglycerol--serine O-phosphatidyltransferase n=1 Tax=Undibacterium sp. Jales W-56 TaxID=2897325 RepID=UPI0021CE61C0|nr:CDP-diacylglycerol--serine O-phosphatidyltransferase [Undibacterium sp. Jales W-56]MCU6433575.1 CDP-diacylglycerol--serine O-phosphatidyltransferase [Undibacterium sp. Jales W-56]